MVSFRSSTAHPVFWAHVRPRGRGWFPEQIEVVSSKYRLEGHPPPLEGVPEWTDILIAKQCRAEARAKDTAMAVAFNKAKDRAA